ncbi:MAG TPA: hypothetical protein PLQ35_17290 [bacterium]|nr:hypothetical protein [bacterium]HQL64034.1 hypothetical protein [bacterium]
MLIADFSGIQDYLFAVPSDVGGQARMLRAKSFYLQLITECAAIRLIRALGLTKDDLLFCAAGKFAIDLDSLNATQSWDNTIEKERRCIERWLLEHTAGHVGFSLAWETGHRAGTSFAARYDSVLYRLQIEKRRPWCSAAQRDHHWTCETLCLNAVDQEKEQTHFETIGRELIGAQWVTIASHPDAVASQGAYSFEVLDLNVRIARGRLSAEPPGKDVFVIPLEEDRSISLNTIPNAIMLNRSLLRHVPIENGQQVLFETLAKQAKGAPLLGVLKMDVDSLGMTIAHRLERDNTKKSLSAFSRELDRFFSVELGDVLQNPPWNSVYTVFSGGDDLLLVGPWDVVVDVAEHVHQLFHRRFGSQNMTISAGLDLIKYHYPIRQAAEHAEDLLHLAKTTTHSQASFDTLSETPKDQIAFLGLVWKWSYHKPIIDNCKRLMKWVEAGVVKRGWLQAILELVLLYRGQCANRDSRGNPDLAHSRLVYHVARNWPKINDKNPDCSAARKWIDDILEHVGESPPTYIPWFYLPVIIRYAMLATRSREKEEENES